MSITTVVTITNAIGVVLMLVLIITNRDIFNDNSNAKHLFYMGYIVIASCLADMATYYLEGVSGAGATVALYALNSWLFISNMLLTMHWSVYLCNHIGAYLSRTRKMVFNMIFAAGLLMLIVNLFYPLVFSITDNHYAREPFYFAFMAIDIFYILDGIIVYLQKRKKNGMLVYFPIAIFLTPVVAGIILQTIYYGVSVIWVSVAIAIVGMVSCLKNECLFIDRLTGVYNRHYMEQIKKKIAGIERVEMTGVMADLNSFKSINDNFGHSAGDDALVNAARIFQKAVGDKGKVIRYAGDEFVLLINSVDPDQVKSVIDGINQGFEAFNKEGKEKYHLSASMGYQSMNIKEYTIDEFINVIDRKMYENKQEYYKNTAG